MTKRTIFNRHFLHYYFLDRDIKSYSCYLFGNVLDVGAGKKPYKELFSMYDYQSMDVDGDHDYKEDICCNHIPSDSFRSIICSQVLEHVSDHELAIFEMKRILKRGGYMLITVPFSWEIHGDDYRRFTPLGIQQILPGALVKANGGQWAAIGQLKCNAVRGIFKGLIPFMNLFYLLLDKLFYNPKFTLNFLVLWQKPR